MSYHKIKQILTFLLVLAAIPVYSATEKEMAAAEAIAAKQYLRWSNNASGYLDEISVSSVTELEGKLRTQTDKDNLRTFRNVTAVKSDYSTWSREELIEYWGNKCFNSANLSKEGKRGHSSAMTKIKAWSKNTPETTPKEKPAPTEAKPETPKPETIVTEKNNPLAELENDEAATDSTLLAATQLEEKLAEEKKPSSNLYIYGGILILLVIFVIILISYATKVIKNSESSKRNSTNSSVSENDEALRRALDSLQRRYNSEMDENKRLKQDLDFEKQRNEQLSSEISALRTSLLSQRQSQSNPEIHRQNVCRNEQPEPKPDNIIYLGRVNKDGIFVRADRTPAPGHTIFLLRTDDGLTGSYRLVNNPEVWKLCLDNPEKFLTGGAKGDHLEYSEGFSKIVNKSAGTAIFEDGYWRVLRKATVEYA